MVPADSGGIPRVPPYLGTPPRAGGRFAYGPITLSGTPFQTTRLAPPARFRGPYYPAGAATPAVWAPPLSLAATRGITVVFSSSGYWDVSVRRVRPRPRAGGWPSASRVAPFGYPRVNGHVRLAGAFRRLSRPSSPPEARASTVRPASLPARSRRWASRPPRHSRAAPRPLGRGPTSALSLLMPMGRHPCPRHRTLYYHVKERYRGECRSRTDDPLLAKQVL